MSPRVVFKQRWIHVRLFFCSHMMCRIWLDLVIWVNHDVCRVIVGNVVRLLVVSLGHYKPIRVRDFDWSVQRLLPCWFNVLKVRIWLSLSQKMMVCFPSVTQKWCIRIWIQDWGLLWINRFVGLMRTLSFDCQADSIGQTLDLNEKVKVASEIPNELSTFCIISRAEFRWKTESLGVVVL